MDKLLGRRGKGGTIKLGLAQMLAELLGWEYHHAIPKHLLYIDAATRPE